MPRPGDIAHRFAYHPPQTEQAIQRHEKVRAVLGEAAQELNNILTDSRETSLFLTHVEEAMMWANADIARNQR